jgi:ABC-type antimicrobial peptide transport system permease subunit
VTSAGAAQKIPLRGSGDNWGLSVVGKPDLPSSTTAFRMVTRGYFATMGMEIRAGRNFDGSDREGSDRVVIINEALASKYFPGEDPIGRALRTFDDRGERIIGVVSNAAEADLTDGPVAARYMLFEHVPQAGNALTFAVRTDSEERVAALMDAVRATIGRQNSQLAIQQMTTMQTVFDMSMGAVGQVVTLLTLLAGLALVLGAVGVYGAISHYVTRRARDYGIQIALGQQPQRVIRQVVARGVTLVAIGSLIGTAAAIALTKVLASLLYGVESTDPLALGAAVLLLLFVGALAAFLPARRASLLDPVVVLRQ